MLPRICSLDRKLLRDVWRMRGQLAAIAVVVACGIAVFVAMRSTMHALENARSSYYARQRFGHVFARLERAPERVAKRLAEIPGVRAVQTRVLAAVTLDLPRVVEAAVGLLVSLPDSGRPAVNDVVLRSGRMPHERGGDEVLVSELFFTAQDGFALGDSITATIQGKRRRLRVVGTALSPEFTYATAPGQLFPDNRRFGVIWMRRSALAAAFDLEGAFNDVSLLLNRDASSVEVVRRVDRELARYGGLGAIEQGDQQSGFFVENELAQLSTFAAVLPALFLAVAAFLLNIVVGRVVAGQREQLAALKALGYRDREVGLHYAKFVALVVVAGAVAGVGFGAYLGSSLTRAYLAYYRFPDLPYVLAAKDVVVAVGIAAVAAALGTWAAIRRTVVLPAAEALRPEAPPVYRPTLFERLGLSRFLPMTARMVLRETERKPLRSLMTCAGIAMATGLTILNAFMFDSMRHLLNVQFGLSQRDDVQVVLYEPRAVSALHELESLPGVGRAEGFRTVPVRLRSGIRSRNTAITGVGDRATMHRVLAVDLGDVEIPPKGLVLSRKLAEVLGVEIGSMVQVSVLEGKRVERELEVARLVETFVGTAAYMRRAALCELLGEADSMNGAWLSVDDRRHEELHEAVKSTPTIASATAHSVMLREVQRILDENIGRWVIISLGFSLALAFGVLFNSVRITLAERARDLASLRVLGFRRREVAAMLLGELGLLTVVATLAGLLLGRGFAALFVASPGFNTEQFRLPLVISSSTYGLAALTVLVAAALSSWNAWRKLDRVDIVEVLKAKD